MQCQSTQLRPTRPNINVFARCAIATAGDIGKNLVKLHDCGKELRTAMRNECDGIVVQNASNLMREQVCTRKVGIIGYNASIGTQCFQELRSFGSRCGTHVKHTIVGFRIEYNGRNHTDGFLASYE